MKYMKKGVLLVTCALLLLIAPALAAENDTDAAIQKAYQCLQAEIGNKSSSTLSLQESIFGMLALGDVQKLRDKIESERSNNCWPKSGCRLKETAQVLLAYDYARKDTSGIKKYFSERNGSTTDLTWFIMIDIANHVPATCTIKNSGSTRTINIGEDMKLSGEGGSCLSIISSGYWLQISSSCIDQKYDISCNQDFVTTLLYQKSGVDTIYVSPETHSAASSGTTSEQVNAKCFKQGSSCNYEGTLWAALALQQLDEDVSAYVPYLLALAPENQNLLPSSFIFKLTNADDHYSTLVQAQKQGKFWEAPNTPYNKFYDTSLALLALQGRDSAEADAAIAYLEGIQTPKGCWNNDNIRDTAFILYSAFPDSTRRSTSSPSGPTIELCESTGKFSCAPALECTQSGGSILGNYACGGSLKCCSIVPKRQLCSQLAGNVCGINERCVGTEIPSADGSCCTGSCSPIESNENQCVLAGGLCQNSCDTDLEIESLDQCTAPTDVCCIAKTETESSGNWFWIIILGILIIIVAIAILYRKKLQLWYYRFKNRGGVKSSPIVTRRPPFPPTALPSATRPFSPSPQPQRRPQPSRLDNEMEETLKKLREMSK